MPVYSNFYDHILFIERLIDNYKNRLDANLIEDLTSQLNYIKEKHQDKLLNISVVGDFSTGKSTFINALLKYSLLEAENMQSTTTASTIIEHDNFFGIEVNYKKHVKTGFTNVISSQNDCIKRFNTLQELKNEIRNFGASLDKSLDIEKINVYLPSSTLNGVFRIIDTPGLDALDSWLTDITKSTIEKISDASVIVVPYKGLPKSLIGFIKQNLSNVLSQSVFIIPKLDEIRREKERIISLEYVKKQIEHEFNLKDPLILPYISTEVLKNCGEEEGEINQQFLQITQKSEKELLDYVKNKKKEAQTNKLNSMIERLYEAVSEQVKSLKFGFESELDLLLRSKQSDLKSFVSKQKVERCKEFIDVFSDLSNDYKLDCYEARNKCVSIFLERIDNVQCSTAQELKDWCESCFEQMAMDLKKWMYDKNQLNQDVFGAFNDVALGEVNKFQKIFEQYFAEYDLLRVNFDSSDLTIDSCQQNSYTGFEAQKYILNQAVKSEDEALDTGVKGGATTGAILGTLLFGPLGGVFGAMIAGSLGSLFGSLSTNIEEVKGKIKESIEPNLHRIFTQSADELISNYQINIDARCKFISNELDRYLKSYQDEVDRRITIQEVKRSYIEEQIRVITLDLNDIEKQKKQICMLNFID